MTLSLENYQSAFENMYDAVMISQCKGNNAIVFISNSFTELTGYTENDVLGQPFELLYSNEGNIVCEAVTMQTFMKQRHSSIINLIAYKKDGTPFEVQVAISKIKNSRGRTTHYVSVIRDFTMQAELEKLLFKENAKLVAEKDALAAGNKYDDTTGLLKRSSLQNEVKGLFAGVKRSKEYFTLFFIGFSTVNSTQNNDNLDMTTSVKKIANILTGSLQRSSDILLRYSETTFIICFTGQPTVVSEAFANKITESFKLAKSTGDLDDTITISLGLVSDIPTEECTLDDYILAADSARFEKTDQYHEVHVGRLYE